MAYAFSKEIAGTQTLKDLETLKGRGLLKGFYLAGGTGAALLMRHRRSRDLDFFSPRPFNERLLAKKLSRAGRFELEKKEEGTVVGLFGHTRVSFFYYPYRLLRRPHRIGGINVVALPDIACMKLDAVSSRGSKKDFIDIYFILKSGYSLKSLLRYFRKKFSDIHYNMIHVQKGLVYFKDAEHEKMPSMLIPVEWDSVKKFFINEVKNLYAN